MDACPRASRSCPLLLALAASQGGPLAASPPPLSPSLHSAPRLTLSRLQAAVAASDRAQLSALVGALTAAAERLPAAVRRWRLGPQSELLVCAAAFDLYEAIAAAKLALAPQVGGWVGGWVGQPFAMGGPGHRALGGWV